MFDPNFFPTPPEVIGKMLAPHGDLNGKSVLEPSAGRGDILDWIKDSYLGARLYCLEKNPDLQSILSDKGHRLIGDDFLGYEADHDFDLIAMNPPFDEGDKHLLKAWEILRGGDIVCLLNAETVKNPHTKMRQLLKRIIDDHGSVEYLGQCFSTAERKTDVEVALVRLRKEAEGEGFDFGPMETEGERGGAEKSEASMVSADAIKAIVAGYAKAREDFGAAVAALERVGNALVFLTGGRSWDRKKPNLDPAEIVHKYDSPRERVNGFADETKEAVWGHIMDRLGVQKYMTESVRKDFMAKVRKMSDMAISERNIQKIVMAVFQNRNEILEKGVGQVFDLFTQYHSENRCHVEGWKTNDRWKANRRIILPHVIDEYKGYESHYSVGQRGTVGDIEKCMCYLAGRQHGQIRPLHELVGLVEVGDSSWHQGEFFDFRCYKKGTIHLYFRDEWLWKEFNMRACALKAWLPEAEKREWEESRRELVPLSLA